MQAGTDHAKMPPGQLRPLIDGALSRDRGRLLGLLGTWQGKPGDPAARDAFLTRLQASISERERRAVQLPQATVDASLPIAAHAEEIIALIRQHQVVVIAGETGSGKTTQLPKLCLAAGRGAAGMVGCTQPRRIAASSGDSRWVSGPQTLAWAHARVEGRQEFTQRLQPPAPLLIFF